MRNKSVKAVGFAFLFLTALLFGEGKKAEEFVFIQNGFLTGEKYLKIPKIDRAFYVMGLYDGICLVPLFGDMQSETWFTEIKNQKLSSTQMAAILDKYLEDNPKDWHLGANSCFLNAMNQSFNPAYKK